MSNDVIALYLINDVEIVGKQITEVDGKNPPGSITLMEPMKVVLMQTPGGKLGPGLMPFVLSNPRQKYTFKAEFIMLQIEPHKGMINMYLQQTSGIQVADNLNNIVTN